MVVPDVPNVPDQYVLGMAAESRPSPPSRSLTLGVCQPVPNMEHAPQVGGEHGLEPAGLAISYLERTEKSFQGLDDEGRRSLVKLYESARVTLVQKPAYGKLIRTTDAFPEPSANRSFYQPLPGDMRKDRVVYLVEMGDYKVKVIYSIYPVPHGTGPETESEICGKRGTLYKVGSDGADFFFAEVRDRF